MMCAMLISVIFVALWLTDDLGATEGSNVIPSYLFLVLRL